jgi:hypothetical protein
MDRPAALHFCAKKCGQRGVGAETMRARSRFEEARERRVPARVCACARARVRTDLNAERSFFSKLFSFSFCFFAALCIASASACAR